MDTRNLTDLNPATLAALAKLSTTAAAATREDLEVGVHTVDTVVTVVLGAEVKVLEGQTGVSTPQKAKPWNLIHILLAQLNETRAALNLAGIDIAKVTEMATKVDEDLATKAKKDAEAAMKALKLSTLSDRKGQVKVKGDAGLPTS